MQIGALKTKTARSCLIVCHALECFIENIIYLLSCICWDVGHNQQSCLALLLRFLYKHATAVEFLAVCGDLEDGKRYLFAGFHNFFLSVYDFRTRELVWQAAFGVTSEYIYCSSRKDCGSWKIQRDGQRFVYTQRDGDENNTCHAMELHGLGLGLGDWDLPLEGRGESHSPCPIPIV